MSEITEFYQQQVQQQTANGLADIPWLLNLKKDALADFRRIGFPTRKDEEWKYTSVDAFSKQRFVNAGTGKITANVKTDIPIDCLEVTLINGEMTGADRLAATLPPGVIVQPLAQAMLEHADKVQHYLGQIMQSQHGFQALNTAMLQCGLFIYLPEGSCLSKPLLLSHWQDQSQQATYVRNVVIAEAGSNATIIENYQGDQSVAYFTNAITEVYAAAKSALTHYKFQRESKLAYHISHLAVKQAKDSQFDSHLFSFGGKLVRSDATFSLEASRARCSMNGIYAPADGQHMDHHTLVNHAVADCNSAQDYKGILTGHSRAVFNGKVVVAKDAQRTEAKQQNKNLLLSMDAEIDTKPQLEIFADDVVCTHGATVGQLDEEALFYLATRGIEYAEASQYLVQAFAHENVRAINDAKLADWLSSLLIQQIG